MEHTPPTQKQIAFWFLETIDELLANKNFEKEHSYLLRIKKMIEKNEEVTEIQKKEIRRIRTMFKI